MRIVRHVLAFLFAACAPLAPLSPLAAQSLPLAERQVEPPIPPGAVAVRFRNDTECVIGLRAKRDEQVVGFAKVDPKGGTLWLHLRPAEHTLALEVIASPRLCPSSDSTSAPSPAPAVRITAVHGVMRTQPFRQQLRW